MLILGDFLRPFWVGIIGHFVMLIKSQYVRTFLGAKNADDCQMEAVPSWVARAWPAVSGWRSYIYMAQAGSTLFVFSVASWVNI